MKMMSMSYVVAALCLLVSCADDREVADVQVPNPSVGLSAEVCTLSQERAAEEALTVSWEGDTSNSSARYTVELSVDDGSATSSAGAWSRTFGNATTSFAMTHEQLNRLLIDRWRVPVGSDVRVKVRVETTASVHWMLRSAADSTFVTCRAYMPVYPEHNHRIPLYWSPYEYNFLTNRSMPESEWKLNIDWVADNLKSYGYTMVSTDGWMDESDAYDADGYLDRHSLAWEHDYGWWADYLNSKGMQLGVYANPLWVPSGAARAGLKIKGTDIPIESIVNRSEENGGRHNYLWAQLDREGAEEWVRGYVDHFGEMGVKFLRVDFLSWYEDGFDIGYGTVGPERPHWMYESALRWMREECDRYGMILSLVMPHLYNDAATEKNYGHMIRIDNDTAEGGWWHFSEVQRGVHRVGWSQYSNAFDGFVYFSRVSGRGRVMLDGDFIRLNTMDSDDECRSIVSLAIIAGGPVAVADRYNSAGARLQFYRNRELLALNEEGFTGKPLSDDPVDPLSQTWWGETLAGDVVVAVFNREQSDKEYRIVPSEFGITGSCSIRDLWTHETYSTPGVSGTIPPHGCVVVKITKK